MTETRAMFATFVFVNNKDVGGFFMVYLPEFHQYSSVLLENSTHFHISDQKSLFVCNIHMSDLCY